MSEPLDPIFVVDFSCFSFFSQPRRARSRDLIDFAGWHWLNMRPGVVENWAFSVDRCWLVLQFLVYFLDLLSLLLRCNGFTGILKAVVAEGQLPTSDLTYFWCKCDSGKCSGAFSQSSH